MTTRRSTPTPSYQGAPGGPTGGVPRPAPNAPYNPGADTATYRDLLLFEERLKMNAEMLRRRRRRYNGELGSRFGWLEEWGEPTLSRLLDTRVSELARWGLDSLGEIGRYFTLMSLPLTSESYKRNVLIKSLLMVLCRSLRVALTPALLRPYQRESLIAYHTYSSLHFSF